MANRNEIYRLLDEETPYNLADELLDARDRIAELESDITIANDRIDWLEQDVADLHAEIEELNG